MELISIGEASRRHKVNVNKLRRLEERGLIESVRTSGGHRRYNAPDLERFFASDQDAPIQRSPLVLLSGADFAQTVHETAAKRTKKELTGITELDELLGLGLGYGNLHLWLEKYCTGFDHVLSKISLAAQADVRILACMLEDSPFSVTQRMLMQEAGYDMQKSIKTLQRGFPTQHLKAISEGHLVFADHSHRESGEWVSVEDIEAALDAAEDMWDDAQARIVLIDNVSILQLEPDPDLPVVEHYKWEREQTARVIEKLGELAQRRSVTILARHYLPKEYPSGEAFRQQELDSFTKRYFGGSRPIDYCASVLAAWRPEHLHEETLSDIVRRARFEHKSEREIDELIVQYEKDAPHREQERIRRMNKVHVVTLKSRHTDHFRTRFRIHARTHDLMRAS